MPIRLQHRADPDHERHRGAGGLGWTSIGARWSASRRFPACSNAAFAWGVPLTGNNWPATVEIEGQPAAVKASDRIAAAAAVASPRTISSCSDWRFPTDATSASTDIREAPNVAVVNQALVDRYFPAEASRSARRSGWAGGEQPPTEIVGVVANGRTDDLTQAAEPEIYLSFWQASAFSKHLVVRTAGDPRSRDGGGPARTARGGSDRRRGEHEDAGADSQTTRWPRARSRCSCWSDLRWWAAC